METAKKHGGKREGAGRKRTTVKSYAFHAPQEVYDILEAVKGTKSEFINRCILEAHKKLTPAE